MASGCGKDMPKRGWSKLHPEAALFFSLKTGSSQFHALMTKIINKKTYSDGTPVPGMQGKDFTLISTRRRMKYVCTLTMWWHTRARDQVIPTMM
jgi:hypothetical protein